MPESPANGRRCPSRLVVEGTSTGTHVATLRLPVGDFRATGSRVANRFVAGGARGRCP